MANAPTVQTLDQIMASLQPGYQAQQAIIGQQSANTDATYKAQSLALDAAKTQGFNQINDQATGKGNTFSGLTTGEQANYLSTTYLPGVQQAQAKQNSDKLTLAGQAAALNTDMRTKALDTQNNQTQAVNQWNLSEAQIQAQAREGAANRGAAASAANTATAEQARNAGLLKDLTNNTGAYLASKQGGDNHVAPSTWQHARQAWVAQGGSVDAFNSTFSGYVNSGYKTYAADYGLF
jgi:hypothetical protein